MLTMVVELEDKPGQLIKVLEPISRFNGNVISVVHRRDETTPLGRIPVRIAVQIDEKKIEDLIKAIKDRGIVVRSYNRVRLTATASVLLIGHIIETDLKDTIGKIDSTGFAEVVEMRISMPELDKPSTAFMTISAENEKRLEDAIGILRKTCGEKDIVVIEPLRTR